MSTICRIDYTYIVCKENTFTWDRIFIVNPWLTNKVNIFMVRDIFESQTNKEELGWQKVLDVKCSGSSKVFIIIKISDECILFVFVRWMIFKYTINTSWLSEYPLPTCCKYLIHKILNYKHDTIVKWNVKSNISCIEII